MKKVSHSRKLPPTEQKKRTEHLHSVNVSITKQACSTSKDRPRSLPSTFWSRIKGRVVHRWSAVGLRGVVSLVNRFFGRHFAQMIDREASRLQTELECRIPKSEGDSQLNVCEKQWWSRTKSGKSMQTRWMNAWRTSS